jgi:hypothetical protein
MLELCRKFCYNAESGIVECAGGMLVKQEGFDWEYYKDLTYYEPLRVAAKENDLDKIKALSAEYDRGIYFKEHISTVKHSMFKRELYIYEQLREAAIEAKTTDIRYSAEDVFAEMRVIVGGKMNV